MLTVQARLSTVEGKGVGRWRNYYRAGDDTEVDWAIRYLVPSVLIRVMDGREIVVPSQRVAEYLRKAEA